MKRSNRYRIQGVFFIILGLVGFLSLFLVYKGFVNASAPLTHSSSPPNSTPSSSSGNSSGSQGNNQGSSGTSTGSNQGGNTVQAPTITQGENMVTGFAQSHNIQGQLTDFFYWDNTDGSRLGNTVNVSPDLILIGEATFQHSDGTSECVGPIIRYDGSAWSIDTTSGYGDNQETCNQKVPG